MNVDVKEELYRIIDVLLTIDWMFVSPCLKSVWSGRRFVEVDNREIAVVSRAGLTTMKRMAGRPNDLLDLEGLGWDIDDA